MMNKKSVFIDTGAWLALSDTSDQYHEKAANHLKKLITDEYKIITTNLVIHETFMLLSRRISRKTALLFLDEVYNADNIEIFHSDQTLETEAFETIRKYADQDFSVADAVSFAVMKHEDLKRVFNI
ncbi:MAG: PIN domain-containing protein [Chitinispirillaceae bacterium]|nr:PIN domain-containing protein [Chitinispirillaceae bacterium]